MGTLIREESIAGVVVIITRDPYSRKLFVNNLPCSKIDIRKNNTVVHLVEGLPVPIELEQAIAFADPEDLDPEVRIPIDGSGEARGEEGEQQSEDEAPDIVDHSGKGSTGNSTKGHPGIDGYANTIRLGQGGKHVEEEEDSDSRNRDKLVKEGSGLLDKDENDKTGKVGGKTAARTGENGKEGAGKVRGGQGGAGSEGKAGMTQGRGGKNGTVEQSTGRNVAEDDDDDDEDDDTDITDVVNKEAKQSQEVTGRANDGGQSIGDGVDNAGVSFKWFSGISFSSPGAKQGGTLEGQEVSQRRGIGHKTELRGTSDSAAKVNIEAPAHERPEVLCSGRGRLINGLCSCSLLFGGENCETPLEIRSLGIDSYGDELIMSIDLLYAELYAIDSPPNVTTGRFAAPGLGLLAKLASEFVPGQRLELRRALPPYDPLESFTWDSCAIVGSSGSLLLQDLGEEIDAHEMIMRFNGAPAYGYERQVGSRTTLRFSNPEFAGFKEGNETVVYHIWLRDKKAEMEHLLKFKRMFPRDPLLILELGFITAIFNSLGFIPSIGYMGWAFALQKCRRVDLYGFYMGERHGVLHHYYDRNSTSKGTEDIDKEFVAAVEIAEAEVLWIAESCIYDCRRSRQRCSMCLRVSLPVLAQKSEWNETQVAVNAAREKAWTDFSKWKIVEKKRRLDARAKKQSEKARRRPKRFKNKRLPALLQEWGDGSEVPWDTIIAQGRLGELSLRELLLYFRQFHITVPPTRLQMMMSIRNHYFFMHRDLSKHTAKLYRAAD